MAPPTGPLPEHATDPADEFAVLLAPRDIMDGVDREQPRHGRGRRRRRVWPWLLAMFLVLVLLVGGALGAAYSVYPEQVKALFGYSNDYTGAGTGSVDVVIQQGALGSDVATTLAKAGVVKTYAAFYELLVKTNASLEPGTYRLHHHMSAKSALAELQDPASRLESKVVIPEGSTAKQIITITAKSTGVDAAELTKLAKDPTQFGVPKSAPNIEGWLFPATYTFPPKTSAKVMLQTMVTRMTQALDNAGVAKSNRQKVLTMAGLVQKEGNGRDDAKVARVFLNRIEQGIRLQSDATVSYGAGGTTVVPTTAQYANKNPYNTYRRDGLPAGPISNPGDAAIKAALHPAKGPWIFFVTVNLATGETVFSTTDAQHEKAAAQFQAWLKKHPEYGK